MNTSFFITMLFSLQILYWLVGRQATKRLNNKEDYFLAGKSIQFFPLMMTFLATQVGGGAVLGAAEEAYLFGWSVLFYPLGISLGLILLGCGIGSRLATFQVATVAQIFETVYQSPSLRKMASALSVISLFMILIAQLVASQKFLISMGFDNPLLFIAFWAIVILYTAQGGLQAVISTDMVQAGVFSVAFLACFGVVFYYEPATTSLSTLQFNNLPLSSSKLCGWLLMPLLFMVIEQDMGQRCFAGASPKIVSKASLFAGIITLLICAVPIFFGALAQSMGIEVPPGGSILMSVIAATTPTWLTAFVGCAILAAIVSTATSLINAISSNLSNDFCWSIKREILFIRSITCIISIAAIFCAFYLNNIVDLLIQSYELSVSCLFAPIFIAIFRRKGHFLSALLSVTCGAVGFILFRIYPIDFPKEIASVALSFLGYTVGYVFEEQSKKLLSYLENYVYLFVKDIIAYGCEFKSKTNDGND